MANTIAQLLVELGINTAAFKDGLDKATYQAKQFANELKGSFSALGEGVSRLGEAFGGLSPQVSGVFQGISSAIEPLIGSLGTAGGAVAGVGAALAAAGIGALAAAASFAETADRLHELSQATGVSVEALSSLQPIAAADGISIEMLAGGMEKMSRAAVAAALASPKASNGFTELGVAVKNADGTIRSAQSIFDDLSTKFANMPDGPLKTAEAIKIFGRAGANLIPLLNEGGQKISEFREHAEKLNAVITGPTAEASAELKEQTELIKAAFTGVQNELAEDLVPALNVAAKSFVDFFETNQEGIKSFVDGIAEVAKVTLNVFQEVGLIFSLLYRTFYTAVSEIQSLAGTVGNVLGDVASGDFGAIWDHVKQGGKEASDTIKYNFNEALDSINKTGAAMLGVTTAKLPNAKDRGQEGGTPTPRVVDTDFIEKEIDALNREANQQATLAEAIGKVSEKTIEATATAEANLAIEKLISEAKQKHVEDTKAFQDALAAAIPLIQEATTWTASFKAALESQKEFDKFDQNIRKQIATLMEQGDAMTEADREFAKNDATLTPLRNNVAALTAEYEKLAAEPGHDPKKLAELSGVIQAQTKELSDQTDAVRRLDEAWQGVQFIKQLEKINQATDALNIENSALIAGNPYGKLEASLEQFIKTMKLAPEQAKELREALAGQEKSQAASGALGDAKSIGYDPARIAQLKAERDALAQLALPAGVYERTLTKINADIADAEAKTGNWQSGVKAAFADFSASIQSEGQIMQQAVGTALKGISDNLASVVTTGKAQWGDLVQSMEQMLLKSAINNILNSLFKSIGNALGGQGGILGSIGGLFGATPHALGGSMIPGEDYLVGEKGPEIMRVDKPSTMYPTGQGPSNKGGTVINQSFNFPNSDADSFRRSQRQVSSQMYQDASYAHGKHNQ